MANKTTTPASNRIQKLIALSSDRLHKLQRWTIDRVDRAPLASFYTGFGICLLLIIVGNIIRQPKVQPDTTEQPPKEVSVFGIGSNPKISVQAKVEKSGVVTIVAQTSGVVQTVRVNEGASVGKGTPLIGLSTNYQGGNIQSANRQIAQKNYDFVSASFDTQKQMIEKRRELANLIDTQADQMRAITNESIIGTRQLVGLNEQFEQALNTQLQTLKDSNIGGANDAMIAEVEQARVGVLTGLSTLRTGLHTSEYQANDTNAPAQVSDKTRELTNKQLDIELKSLELNRELSGLNLKIAQISESLMYPGTPVAGTVERVHVKVGQLVNPGTVLASIKGNTIHATAVALVSPDIAKKLSRFDKAVLVAGSTRAEVPPTYISSEPTDGSLSSVTFTVPEELEEEVANLANIWVELPIAAPKTSQSVPFVPIDAVFQTQNDAYLFVASSSGSQYIAQSKKITLGNSIGSFVEVSSGLTSSDQIILDRTVSSGDPVSIK